MAQLVEWSLPIPEARGSNPVTVAAKFTVDKTVINKEEAKNGPLKNSFASGEQLLEFKLELSHLKAGYSGRCKLHLFTLLCFSNDVRSSQSVFGDGVKVSVTRFFKILPL